MGWSKNLPSSIDVADRDEFAIIDGGDDCDDERVKRSLSKNLNGTTSYLTLEDRLAFTKLRKSFTKALILQHFDPECHIRIETNMLGFAISGVLS